MSLVTQLAEALRTLYVLELAGSIDPTKKAVKTQVLAALAAYDAQLKQLDSKRNWPEDASQENGDYENVCHQCKHHFIGHKRRITCKLCAAPENGNAVALIEACSKLHRENHPLVSPTEPGLPVRTRILINLEGGLVQAVLADRELVDVIIIDYDTDGADDNEITEIQQDDGDWAEAIARIEVATVDPVFINRAFNNINQET